MALTKVSGNILDPGINVAGVVTCQDMNSLSDVTLKENITTVDSALDKVSKIRGVKFDWKHRDENDQIGLIAQNVEEHIPEAIKEQKLMFYSNNDGKDYKTINYDY